MFGRADDIILCMEVSTGVLAQAFTPQSFRSLKPILMRVAQDRSLASADRGSPLFVRDKEEERKDGPPAGKRACLGNRLRAPRRSCAPARVAGLEWRRFLCRPPLGVLAVVEHQPEHAWDRSRGDGPSCSCSSGRTSSSDSSSMLPAALADEWRATAVAQALSLPDAPVRTRAWVPKALPSLL